MLLRNKSIIKKIFHFFSFMYFIYVFDLFPLFLLRRKPELSSAALKNGLKQDFDFSSVITIAGLWAIWQAYLVKNVINNC